MSGCGYVCPVCEGKGYDEEGNACDYCTSEKKPTIYPTDKRLIPYKRVATAIITLSIADKATIY